MKTTIDMPDDVRLRIMALLMSRGKTRGLQGFVLEAVLEKLDRETPDDLTSAKRKV